MSAPVQRVVAALKARGSKPANEREETWTCPAHRDSTASMSLSEGGDGRALIHCHAGCESDAILDALGLTRRDLFADVPRSDTGAIHYVYTDADGHPLCRVTRLPGKDFRQSRYAPADPDANADGYLNRRGCMKDVQRVLYRLPAVAAAVAAGETIYVTEGEKDADALTRAGVVATTAPQGAGKWHRVDATPLAGAEVVIVADRDQEGRKHAEQVRADLVGRGCRVRVVEAAEGKDADDHLAAGHGIDDFTPLPEAGINQPADFASAVAVAAGVERGELSHLDPGSLAPPWDRVANLAQKSAGEYEGSVDGLLSWLMPGWCESVGSSHGHISEELRRARSSLNGAATSDYMREAAAAATVGPWTPPSILDGVDLDAPPPAPEILGLIYPEKLHLVSGRPEAAKTWLALALGVEATRNGGALLIIDTDGTGQRDLAHRLRGLGLDSDALADVAYTDSPREVFAAENLPGLQGWIRERATRGPVIVVIDSANPTLAALSYRLDEEGMSQLEAAAIKPLKAAGATVLLIDHIAIHADRDSPYSIGTQRKHAAADVHLRLDSIGEPLTRGGQPSTFAIRGMKDRPGGIERHGQQRHVGRVTFTPGPGGAVSYSIELGPPTAGEQRATWRPTRLMERVSAWAANQPGAFSKRTAESEVSGKGEAIRAAIDALYAEGYLTASGDKWKHAQTYREADDPEAEE